MPNYTDKTQVENYLGLTLPAALNTQINNWITAVEQWIDNYTGLTFVVSDAADKYFDGSGSRWLLVENFYGTPTISILDNDGNVDFTVSSANVDLYPLNRTSKDRIHLKPGAETACWPKRENSIKINATWGWAGSIPEEIKLAATRLMAHLLNKRLKGGDATSETLGDYSISYSNIEESANLLGVTNILDQYRNLEI